VPNSNASSLIRVSIFGVFPIHTRGISSIYLNNAAAPITTFAADLGAVINMKSAITNGYKYQIRLLFSKRSISRHYKGALG